MVVANTRALKYVASEEVYYKTRHPEAYQLLPQRRKASLLPAELEPLFSTAPRISSEKFNHLQEMKSHLPSEHHSFYDSLPHQ